MKERILINKFEEKKSKIKERLKLKLEYSEKVKNNENIKVLKKLNNIKKKELPKLKVLNHHYSNTKISENFNYNPKNNDSNFIIYNKIKKGINSHNQNQKIYKSAKMSSQNLQNMNLISFNENINNIYKKVTINDFNNKDLDQKSFYQMIQNFNIIESNSIDNKKNNKKFLSKMNITPTNLKKFDKSLTNEKIVLNILNQSKEDNNIIHEVQRNNTPNQNDGKRFNFLRKNRRHETLKLRKPVINKDKYLTSKVSPRNLVLDFSEDNEIIESKQNKINELNNKKLYKEDEENFINNNISKNSFDYEMTNNDLLNKKNEDTLNNNSDKESSDVTIISLKSEEIKDLSSDFSEF